MFALLDVDRFKAIHASLGDAGRRCHSADDGATGWPALDEAAQVFRVGGDSFALLFAEPRRAPQAIGDALVEVCAQPFRLEDREVFAPCSIGLASGRAKATIRSP